MIYSLHYSCFIRHGHHQKIVGKYADTVTLMYVNIFVPWPLFIWSYTVVHISQNDVNYCMSLLLYFLQHCHVYIDFVRLIYHI
jgi:hypothetical protein